MDALVGCAGHRADGCTLALASGMAPGGRGFLGGPVLLGPPFDWRRLSPVVSQRGAAGQLAYGDLLQSDAGCRPDGRHPVAGGATHNARGGRCRTGHRGCNGCTAVKVAFVTVMASSPEATPPFPPAREVRILGRDSRAPHGGAGRSVLVRQDPPARDRTARSAVGRYRNCCPRPRG